MEYTEHDIDFLVSNREAFDTFVYTPLAAAILELKSRWNDNSLVIDLETPSQIASSPKAMVSVSLVTPNQMVRRFISLANSAGLDILATEHLKDKFVSRNYWKRSLGKMPFLLGQTKVGAHRFQHQRIVDFNLNEGKSLDTVHTLWGQSLVDFHHQLLSESFPEWNNVNILDLSDWYFSNGNTSHNYYKSFLALFVKNAVLFENYYLTDEELGFIKSVFLPAFIHVYKTTGIKPLITPLEPPHDEGNQFWYSHSPDTLDIVNRELARLKNYSRN